MCNLHQHQKENGSLTEDSKRQYTQPMSRKIRAREEKQFDKDYAKKNLFCHTVTFDLQAVSHCPCSNVSQVYYKRKLNCCNLSVYSLGNNAKAICFMWNGLSLMDISGKKVKLLEIKWIQFRKHKPDSIYF